MNQQAMSSVSPVRTAPVLGSNTSTPRVVSVTFPSVVVNLTSGSPNTVNRLPAPSTTFHRIARRFAEALAASAGVSIDLGVDDKVRLFRAPNSRHPTTTALHKRRLTLDELLHLNAARVRQLAAMPEPFALRVVTVADPQAVADWQAALQAVEREAEARTQRRATVVDRAARLNRATLDFIRDGADTGDRHRLLFSAAANRGHQRVCEVATLPGAVCWPCFCLRRYGE